MPNKPQRRTPDWPEAIATAFSRAGANPLATRAVRGQLTYDQPGFGFSRSKLGAIGVDEAVPAATAATLDDSADKPRVMDLRPFSASELYLVFTGGTAPTASIEAYRIQDNGDVVLRGSWTNVGNRVAVEDVAVQGRKTIYRIKDITPDGATAVVLKVAGEGLGFVE